MTTAIVGLGVVGSALKKHLESRGETVLGIDRDTSESIKTAVVRSEATGIAVMPISKTGEILNEVANVALSGSLVFHCTSVEHPVKGVPIDPMVVLERGATYAHIHPHFKPEDPLSQTMRGHTITVHLEGDVDGRWQRWIADTFGAYGPRILWLKQGQHDLLTSVSQLPHMLWAVMASDLWRSQPKDLVAEALCITGLPGQLAAMSAIRTAGQPQVPAEIIACHPHSPAVIQRLTNGLVIATDSLDTPDLLAMYLDFIKTRLLPREVVARYDSSTALLAQLLADLTHCQYREVFSRDENIPGLLGNSVWQYTERGVDLSTTVARTLPDGGCEIIIGVVDQGNASEEAAEAVRNRSWSE